ncbi:MAG: T9SS type A sorting domain-containing protein [Lentimicrobium sp.]
MIKTRSSLYSNWICYTRADLSFRATILSFTIGNILGIPDSVKTISFQAINADGQNIDHIINDLTMVLSKNHGLSRTMNFYQFPDVPFYILREGVFQLHLVGHDNPPAGIQNLLWHDVHDYSIGDELHTYESSWQSNSSQYSKTIRSVLNKTVNGDTTLYLWENRSQWFILVHGTVVNSGSNINTIIQTVVSNELFDRLPLVAYSLNNGNNFNFLRMKPNTNFELVKEVWNTYGSIYLSSPDDTCFIMNIDIPYSPTVHSYYKGLGGPYYYFGSPSFDGSERRLDYFKKDSIEWGNPYIFPVGTNFHPIDNSNEVLLLFPNPAQNFVNLKFTGNTGEFRLQIYDNSGREIQLYSLKGEINTLDISSLKHGIYLLRCMTDNQILTGKLVKL